MPVPCHIYEVLFDAISPAQPSIPLVGTKAAAPQANAMCFINANCTQSTGELFLQEDCSIESW